MNPLKRFFNNIREQARIQQPNIERPKVPTFKTVQSMDGYTEVTIVLTSPELYYRRKLSMGWQEDPLDLSEKLMDAVRESISPAKDATIDLWLHDVVMSETGHRICVTMAAKCDSVNYSFLIILATSVEGVYVTGRFKLPDINTTNVAMSGDGYWLAISCPMGTLDETAIITYQIGATDIHHNYTLGLQDKTRDYSFGGSLSLSYDGSLFAVSSPSAILKPGVSGEVLVFKRLDVKEPPNGVAIGAKKIALVARVCGQENDLLFGSEVLVTPDGLGFYVSHLQENSTNEDDFRGMPYIPTFTHFFLRNDEFFGCSTESGMGSFMRETMNELQSDETYGVLDLDVYSIPMTEVHSVDSTTDASDLKKPPMKTISGKLFIQAVESDWCPRCGKKTTHCEIPTGLPGIAERECLECHLAALLSCLDGTDDEVSVPAELTYPAEDPNFQVDR